MIIDGFHETLTGQYYGVGLGPWSILVTAVGINPYGLGAIFVILGILWLILLSGMLAHWSWGWPGGLIVGLASLWYLPVGTVFSIIYIMLLLKNRRELRPR